jgi:hypothetical protein
MEPLEEPSKIAFQLKVINGWYPQKEMTSGEIGRI